MVRAYALLPLLLLAATPAHADSCASLYFRVFNDQGAVGRTLNKAVTAIAKTTPSVRRLSDAYKAAMNDPSASDFFTKFLGQLRIGVRVEGKGLAAVPRNGPLIAVANHPFGFADGAAMMSMISQVRPDAKVMMIDVLSIDGIKEKMIPIRGGGDAVARRAANAKAVEDAREWLAEGHALVIFPSGKVASHQPGTKTVGEWEWRSGAARLAQATGATVLPVHIPGENSRTFMRLRDLNGLASTARLPAEIVRMEGRDVTLKVGEAIPAARIQGDPEQATAFLREQYEALKAEGKP